MASSTVGPEAAASEAAGQRIIAGAAGDIELRVDLPDAVPRAVAVCCHPHPLFGGTLTELAIRDDRVGAYIAWMRELGISHVEVSDGTIELDPDRKRDLIASFVAEGCKVLSEVGSKDDTQIMAPYRWVELIQGELDAGAWKVIAEARESGTAGIYRADGEVRMGLIDELAHALPVEKLLFEAPRKDQQVWFLQRFGHEVNLGNITPTDVLSLETLRLGLRSDTMSADGPGLPEDC